MVAKCKSAGNAATPGNVVALGIQSASLEAASSPAPIHGAGLLDEHKERARSLWALASVLRDIDPVASDELMCGHRKSLAKLGSGLSESLRDDLFQSQSRCSQIAGELWAMFQAQHALDDSVVASECKGYLAEVGEALAFRLFEEMHSATRAEALQ